MSKLAETFLAFLDAIGEFYPDGGDLPLETQMALMVKMTEIAEILKISDEVLGA